MSVLPAKLIVVDDVFALRDGLLAFTPSVPFALADSLYLQKGDRLEFAKTRWHGIADTTLRRFQIHTQQWYRWDQFEAIQQG